MPRRSKQTPPPRPSYEGAEQPFAGDVRLFLPLDPWRVLVTLEGATLAPDAVTAVWREREGGLDPSPFLETGEPVALQLVPEDASLAVPVARARLSAARQGPGGLALTFRFDPLDAESWDLLGAP